jgi:hypothetical protein
VNSSLVHAGSAEVWILSGFGTGPSNKIFPVIDAVAGGGADPPSEFALPPVAGGNSGVDGLLLHEFSESNTNEQTTSENVRMVFSFSGFRTSEKTRLSQNAGTVRPARQIGWIQAVVSVSDSGNRENGI